MLIGLSDWMTWVSHEVYRLAKAHTEKKGTPRCERRRMALKKANGSFDLSILEFLRVSLEIWKKFELSHRFGLSEFVCWLSALSPDDSWRHDSGWHLIMAYNFWQRPGACDSIVDKHFRPYLSQPPQMRMWFLIQLPSLKRFSLLFFSSPSMCSIRAHLLMLFVVRFFPFFPS